MKKTTKNEKKKKAKKVDKVKSKNPETTKKEIVENLPVVVKVSKVVKPESKKVEVKVKIINKDGIMKRGISLKNFIIIYHHDTVCGPRKKCSCELVKLKGKLVRRPFVQHIVAGVPFVVPKVCLKMNPLKKYRTMGKVTIKNG